MAPIMGYRMGGGGGGGSMAPAGSPSGFDFWSNQPQGSAGPFPWLNKKGPDVFAGLNQFLGPQLKYQL